MEDLTEVQIRIAKLKERLERIGKQAETDNFLALKLAEAGSNQDPIRTQAVQLYNVDDAADQLLLLSSSILSGDIPEDRAKQVMWDIAKQIERLDDWLTAGGRLPQTWMKNV